MEIPFPERRSALVFLISSAFIWWVAGNRLVLINDEGIFLSHAARIAQGEVLYKDLFGLTGPASYWLLALVFKLFGPSLAAAHAVLTVQMGVLTSIIHSVVAEIADRKSAVVAAFIFLTINAADPAMMTNNHRWDADTYAVAGIVAVWRGRTVLGGFLLALSVWATPIFAITAVTAVAACRLVGQSPWRVVAGGIAGASAGVCGLLLSGSLRAFVDNLLWVKTNYSDVNRMPYGSVIGGYPALFDGASGPVEWAVRIFLVFGLTLPVWLPPLCGGMLLRHCDRTRLYFFLCGTSMIAAVSPRFDIGHLVFAVPIFYILGATFLQRARWAVLPIGGVACLYLMSTVIQRFDTRLIDTRFGQVRTDPASAELIGWLMQNISPGERLFVYPYPPIAYVLTRAQNVSRYCYLHPGLFTEADEKIATEELTRRPPAKILYMDIPEAEYLRMWPSSDPAKLRLRHLHEYVVANFQQTAHFRNLRLYTPPVSARTWQLNQP